jgi:hypothetical protein
VCTYGGEARCIQGFVTKPDGKRLLGRLWYRWEDNIKLGPQGIRWEEMDRIFFLAECRDRWWDLVSAVMNIGIHKMRGIYLA